MTTDVRFIRLQYEINGALDGYPSHQLNDVNGANGDATFFCSTLGKVLVIEYDYSSCDFAVASSGKKNVYNFKS